MKIANLPRAGNKKPRTVVITQGKDPTLVVQGINYITIHLSNQYIMAESVH